MFFEIDELILIAFTISIAFARKAITLQIEPGLVYHELNNKCSKRKEKRW
jgi:hypothetical protein